MNSDLCDLCLRDTSQCEKQIRSCNFVSKYNLCPMCKERTIVYSPICHKCGYKFKAESEE